MRAKSKGEKKMAKIEVVRNEDIITLEEVNKSLKGLFNQCKIPYSSYGLLIKSAENDDAPAYVIPMLDKVVGVTEDNKCVMTISVICGTRMMKSMEPSELVEIGNLIRRYGELAEVVKFFFSNVKVCVD